MDEKNLLLFLNVKDYFSKGYSYKIIRNLLEKQCGLQLSIRTLSRVLNILKLKRRNIEENPIEEIVAAILIELEGSGFNLGYRAMWKRLKRVYDLNVKQKTVMRLLRIIDPAGVEGRCRYQLKRREYTVPGPNYIWHADNHDKLKRFGFPIYGCIDGYSKKVLWLRVSKTNNDPDVIGSYYLDAIRKYGFLPTLMRTDRGTEATLMEDFHMALRSKHNDEFAGIKSFLRGKSTRNQRIESYWRQFRQHMGDFYIQMFKKMEENRLFEVENPLHVTCLRYCFGNLIQEDMELSRKEWNEHRVRKQNNRGVLGGIPNELFNSPEEFGTVGFEKEVNMNHVKYLYKYTKEPVLISPAFTKLAEFVVGKISAPTSAEEAYNLYVELLSAIEEGLENEETKQ